MYENSGKKIYSSKSGIINRFHESPYVKFSQHLKPQPLQKPWRVNMKDKDNDNFVKHHEKVKFLKQLEDDVKLN